MYRNYNLTTASWFSILLLLLLRERAWAHPEERDQTKNSPFLSTYHTEVQEHVEAVLQVRALKRNIPISLLQKGKKLLKDLGNAQWKEEEKLRKLGKSVLLVNGPVSSGEWVHNAMVQTKLTLELIRTWRNMLILSHPENREDMLWICGVWVQNDSTTGIPRKKNRGLFGFSW